MADEYDDELPEFEIDDDSTNELEIERIFSDENDIIFCLKDGTWKFHSMKTPEVATKFVELFKNGSL